ncbi:MAG: ATP-binding protein [Aquabacterium sp.]
MSAFLKTRPRWISCWPHALDEADSPGAEGLRRLEFALVQQAAWADALSLPWPAGLTAIQPSSEGWTCSLRAQERRDAQGRPLGLHGVLVPQAPAAQPASPSSAVQHEDPESARLREAEQEALRYAISHDLRAPLRVVEGFTRIVKEDYGRHLDRLGLDHLERVLSASARMNGMIDAILAQAQLAGAPLERVPVDLSALAREIGGELRATLPDPASVCLDVADGLKIDADPLLVRRVLENLIGNAFKYSAKVAAPRVEVGVMPATNPAVFFVRDNGAGFDMQHADKLFGMFQRLHSAKEFPGTGVGLAGVQNIIRRHGGRVWAEAQPGQGACFYFTLMDTLQAQQRSVRP